MNMQRLALVACLVGGFIACPATAGAITASDDGVVTHLNGGPEDNQVTIQPGVGGTIVVTDAAGVTPGEGCVASGANGATCGAGGTITVTATLGDGTNSFTTGGDAMTWGSLLGINVTGGTGTDTVGPDPRAGTPWDIGGGAGNDVLKGSAADDLISGGDGNDEIHGGAGSDLLNGDAGQDTIFGDDGDDTINSNDGEPDDITCGNDEDIVVLDATDKTQSSGGCEGLNDNGTVTTPSKHTKVPKPNAYHRAKKARKAYDGKRLDFKVKGGKVHFKTVSIHLECEFTHDNFDLEAQSGAPKLHKDGTFSRTASFERPNRGLTGKVYVVGAVSGRKARGTIVANATVNSDECTSGPLHWEATG